MQAEGRVRHVEYHELTLPLGAHHTEVTRAISIATEGHGRNKRTISDVTVTADDTHLIIGYQSLARRADDQPAPAEASQ
jgi:hypothetical protein